MLAYAILVTFCFGLLMGSVITVLAAIRMESCQQCDKPVMPPKLKDKRVGPNPFMPDILEYEDQE